MGAIHERVSDIARRCGDLGPLAEPIRRRLLDGNRAVLEAGVSPGSTRPVAPLRPSTLARRKGTGPPRVPERGRSRAIRDCVVQVTATVGRLSFAKSYPTLGKVAEYLNDGTRKMAARPFFEYRAIDIEWVRGEMKAYLLPTGWRSWFRRK